MLLETICIDKSIVINMDAHIVRMAKAGKHFDIKVPQLPNLVELLPSELGDKKVVELQVSAPFHTSLLSKAGVRLNAELEKIGINDLDKKVVSNVDGKVVESKEQLVSKLVNQVSHSVLWQQSVEYMINQGVDTFVEIGPGKSLSGFVKRIGKHIGAGVQTMSISNLDSFHEALNELKKGA